MPKPTVGPRFVDVYLSGRFNPCPCGHRFGDDDIVGLRDHFNKGHFAKWKLELGDDFEVEVEGSDAGATYGG